MTPQDARPSHDEACASLDGDACDCRQATTVVSPQGQETKYYDCGCKATGPAPLPKDCPDHPFPHMYPSQGDVPIDVRRECWKAAVDKQINGYWLLNLWRRGRDVAASASPGLAQAPPSERDLPPMVAPTPTPADLFDVALNGANNALPVLITMLRKVGLKEGLMVADEIRGNVKCALKVYRERRAEFARLHPTGRSLKNTDTAEGRAFWDSVERARDEWEATKPEWQRRVDSAASVSPSPASDEYPKALAEQAIDIVSRLADVYTVDTDQIAVIRLTQEAQQWARTRAKA